MQIREVLVLPVLAEETERFQELMQEQHYLGRLPKIGKTSTISTWLLIFWQNFNDRAERPDA